MNNLNEHIEKLIKFDLGNREKYQKLYTRYSPFDGVLWIFPLLVGIAFVVYNGWVLLRNWVRTALLEQMALPASTKANRIMLILLVIGIVLTVIEIARCLMTVKRDRAIKKRIDNERVVLLKECDSAAEESEKDIYPFWHKFNGMTYKNSEHGDDTLLILPENPIVQDADGHYLADIADGLSLCSGKWIKSTASPIEKAIYFFSEEISPDKKYWRASLYLAKFESAEYTYTEEDDDDRERKVNEYTHNLDDREKAYNLYTTGNYKTNQDMYFEGKDSSASYALSSMIRDEKIRKFKENMSGDFVTRTANEGMWRYWLHKTGYVVLDEECEKIIGIILINAKSCYSWNLLTTDYEPGVSCRIKENTGIKIRFRKTYDSIPIDKPENTSASPRKEKTLRCLPGYPLSSVDFSVPKPENASDEEWGLWIYAHYTDCDLFEDNIS